MRDQSRREIEVAVISDLHLGTRTCRAQEALDYLRGIKPGVLVLNGDIVDLECFSPAAWTAKHTAVMKEIQEMADSGTDVYYVVGNHDAPLLAYDGRYVGGIRFAESLQLTVAGKRTGFHHGDRLGGAVPLFKHVAYGVYDLLRCVDDAASRLWSALGGDPVSLVHAAKRHLPLVDSIVCRYEDACTRFAASRNYEQFVCGHIHMPRIREMHVAGRSVTYLNSGDWVDHLSALECVDGEWQLSHAEQPSRNPRQAISQPAAA